jgi:hypothetical protein
MESNPRELSKSLRHARTPFMLTLIVALRRPIEREEPFLLRFR